MHSYLSKVQAMLTGDAATNFIHVLERKFKAHFKCSLLWFRISSPKKYLNEQLKAD